MEEFGWFGILTTIQLILSEQTQKLFIAQLKRLQVVYGYNTIKQRRTLWHNLINVDQEISKPLLIGGDFNSVLHPQDTLYGNSINTLEVKDFTKCVHDLGLTKLA